MFDTVLHYRTGGDHHDCSVLIQFPGEQQEQVIMRVDPLSGTHTNTHDNPFYD